jgi:uncharacterized protein YPO0396
MSDEQEEMTLEELKAKVSQKDNEIQTLWQKLDEANVEEVEKIKEENGSLRKQVADLTAKVKSLESALVAAISGTCDAETCTSKNARQAHHCSGKARRDACKARGGQACAKRACNSSASSETRGAGHVRES